MNIKYEIDFNFEYKLLNNEQQNNFTKTERFQLKNIKKTNKSHLYICTLIFIKAFAID